jgi:hypothetical protein
MILGIGLFAWIYSWSIPFQQEYAPWPLGWYGVHEGKLGVLLGGLIWRIGLLLDAIIIVMTLYTPLIKKFVGIALIVFISGISAFRWIFFFNIFDNLIPFMFLYPLFSFAQLIGILFLARRIDFLCYPEQEAIIISQKKATIIIIILWALDGIWFLAKDIIEACI